MWFIISVLLAIALLISIEYSTNNVDALKNIDMQITTCMITSFDIQKRNVSNGGSTMTFGENLKRIRKDMKLTQQEMGNKMGISQSYLSDMENSRKCPR